MHKSNRNISDDRLKKVCKIGQGAFCCRYISCDKGGFECEKHTDFGKVIDDNIDNMIAKGDNCNGLR